MAGKRPLSGYSPSSFRRVSPITSLLIGPIMIMKRSLPLRWIWSPVADLPRESLQPTLEWFSLLGLIDLGNRYPATRELLSPHIESWYHVRLACCIGSRGRVLHPHEFDLAGAVSASGLFVQAYYSVGRSSPMRALAVVVASWYLGTAEEAGL